MTNFGNKEFCMECCDKLEALQAWPFSKIKVEQWLSNFAEADKPFALHMVSQFIYLNDQLIDAQFLSSFQSISNIVCSDWKTFDETRKEWNSFLNTCLIVPVQGEFPSPADSGYTFVRKARQILGIPEEQLVDLDEAIKSVIAGKRLPIVFVDDFVGSGEQFTKTLERPSRLSGVHGNSIASLLQAHPDQTVYYCNVTMTQKGKERINLDYPKIALASGNVLGWEYSWVSKNSEMWPTEQRNDGIAMIEEYSKRIGYIDDSGSKKDWRGFHCLGLGIAFEHSTPDSTLPIFFSENNGWKPLVTRR